MALTPEQILAMINKDPDGGMTFEITLSDKEKK